MSEPDVRLALQQPWVSVCNDSQGTAPDGLLGQEHPHPRAYGTFPRILRKYVREDGALTLPDAIRKFSALPAARLRLADRGVIKDGMWADIVVFNPDTITDRRHLRKAQPALRWNAVCAGERRAGDRARGDDERAAGQSGPRAGVEAVRTENANEFGTKRP